jgi:hypothetical protein
MSLLGIAELVSGCSSCIDPPAAQAVWSGSQEIRIQEPYGSCWMPWDEEGYKGDLM